MTQEQAVARLVDAIRRAAQVGGQFSIQVDRKWQGVFAVPLDAWEAVLVALKEVAERQD